MVKPLAPVLGGEGLGVRGHGLPRNSPPHPQPLAPEYGGEGSKMSGGIPWQTAALRIGLRNAILAPNSPPGTYRMPKVLIAPHTLATLEGPHLEVLRQAGFELAFPPRPR